jgi:hypothetical protein
MNSTSNATLTTGLVVAWFCSAFALATGTLWLQFSHRGKAAGFYDPDMLGYLLVLTGILPLGPLSVSTVAAWYGHSEIARRTARVVKCAVPASIFLGWILSKTLEYLASSGVI